MGRTITKHFAVISFAVLVCVLVVSVGFAKSSKHDGSKQMAIPGTQDVFTPADHSSFSIHLAEMDCDVVERFSPDKRYVARILCGDAEVGHLYISLASKGRKHFDHRYLFHVDDVHGCMWVPGSGHSVAYSSGGCDYGRGYLGVWNGKNHWLIRARNDAGEDYFITAYNRQTNEIEYDYFKDNFSVSPIDKIHCRFSLRHRQSLLH